MIRISLTDKHSSRFLQNQECLKMQTPVEIDFQDIDASAELQTAISKHVSDLEERFGRAISCRVVLKGPGRHHRTGGLYEVNIRLALPNGRQVNVGRTQAASRLHDAVTAACARFRKSESDLRKSKTSAGIATGREFPF